MQRCITFLVVLAVVLLAAITLCGCHNMRPDVQYEVPTTDRERNRMEGDLRTTFHSWVETGNALDEEKCDALIDSLMRSGDPSIGLYYRAAQFNGLKGNYKEAAKILKEGIDTFPEEHAPHTILPVRVSWPFWIAVMQRQSGDARKAMKTYKALRAELNPDDEYESFLIGLCSLYMAEIASEDLNEKRRCLHELDVIEQLPECGQEWSTFHTILSGWTAFQRDCILISRAEAMQNLKPVSMSGSRFEMGSHLFFSMIALRESGLASDSIVVHKEMVKRVGQVRVGSMNSYMHRLYCGYDASTRNDYDESDRHFQIIFESESFLSPVAGLWLAGCKNDQKKYNEADQILVKVKTQYPGYEKAVLEKINDWNRYRSK